MGGAVYHVWDKQLSEIMEEIKQLDSLELDGMIILKYI
jgi:hypothetical protein